MRDDGWSRDAPLPKARPRHAGTPAKEYSRPSIERVSLGLEVDDPSFSPSPSDPNGLSKVFAKIPSGSIVISEGGHAVVDCGFGMGLPAGYRVRATSAVQGLIVEVAGIRGFRLSVCNLGGETILNDGQQIGSIWIEPVCPFDWIQKG